MKKIFLTLLIIVSFMLAGCSASGTIYNINGQFGDYTYFTTASTATSIGYFYLFAESSNGNIEKFKFNGANEKLVRYSIKPAGNETFIESSSKDTEPNAKALFERGVKRLQFHIDNVFEYAQN